VGPLVMNAWLIFAPAVLVLVVFSIPGWWRR
jgi:hypothetical protein